MNRGLLAKAFSETWLSILMFGLGVAVTETALAYVSMRYREQLLFIWSQMGAMRPILRGLLGAEVTGQLGPELMLAVPWVHPILLALMWGQVIAYCTRIPAGEVDRGTIDILLGLPISRWQVFGTYTLGWLGSGVVLVVMAAAGNTLGLRLHGQEQTDARRVCILMANMFCLYLAVGGLGWLTSALSNQRGRAVGAALGILLASFLLNYVAQAWMLAGRISFLSILEYYRPLVILRDAGWPVRDMAVLLTVGVTLWTASGIVFSRRDLSTL